MMTISKIFEWDMGHRVTNHASLCKNPHGHRYKLIVTVEGSIITKANSPQQGMVTDFGDLKQLVQQHIVTQFDHAFMYWEKDTVMASFAHANTDLKLVAVPFVPTAECMVQYVAEIIQKELGISLPTLTLQSVRLYETPTSYAMWTPS